MIDLDELERIEQAVTALVIHSRFANHSPGVTACDIAATDNGDDVYNPNGENDAALIVALRNNAAELIRLAKAAPRWIPVSERLPDEGGLVQWYAPGNGDYSQSYGRLHNTTVTEVHFNDEDNEYNIGLYTHWMPLPAPPT